MKINHHRLLKTPASLVQPFLLPTASATTVTGKRLYPTGRRNGGGVSSAPSQADGPQDYQEPAGPSSRTRGPGEGRGWIDKDGYDAGWWVVRMCVSGSGGGRDPALASSDSIRFSAVAPTASSSSSSRQNRHPVNSS